MLSSMGLETWENNLPTINDVFSEVCREESHRNVKFGKTTSDSVESFALVIENTAMKPFDHSKKTHEKPRV